MDPALEAERSPAQETMPLRNPPSSPPSPPAAGATDTSKRLSLLWRTQRGRLIGFAVALAGLAAVFFEPLVALAAFAYHDDVYSHILLIPCIVGYLAWLKRDRLPSHMESSPGWAVVPVLLAAAALSLRWQANARGAQLPPDDALAASAFAFVSLVIAACLAFLGRRATRAMAFPLAMLVFLSPIPTGAMELIKLFFREGSAAVACGFLVTAGVPVFRQDLLLQLPTITMEVADECSGIRSTLVLFITSLLAGHLFLNSPWRRAVLILVVIPIAVLRNGLRIFTIGMLCVHVDPSMINSAIHKHGGPLFFALSLVPFLALLAWMRHSERSKRAAEAAKAKPTN